MAFQTPLPFDRPRDASAGETAAATLAALAALTRIVPARPGRWDELRDTYGRLRPLWQQFFDTLGADGIAALPRTAASIGQQVRDNDITYNVYADNGEPRVWALDMLPLLLDEAEWQRIESAAIQRATLLDAIVADIYGPQTLLKRGLLPPALVYGHPGYLRPLDGFQPVDGRYLHVVALDLARGASGEWTVFAHRTETPSGLGYALENRLIVANVFADAFRNMHVRRLAGAYSHLIATLVEGGRRAMRNDAAGAGASAPVQTGASHATAAKAAESAAGSPHIVLLTPGPYSETYFEHAFLARYLGITLVEGKDLTVRDDKLYLKTFSGLERVHAMLRRMDDAFCDPVELRADSTIGVPGLLQVMRAGNVMVSNVPGSGFIESPALHGFLPGIADALLRAPLEFPGVPTWWCGEAAARDAVCAGDGIGEGLIVPTWPRGGAAAQATHPATHSTTSPAPNGKTQAARDSRAAATDPTPPLPGFDRGPQRLADWLTDINAMPDAVTVQAPFTGAQAPRYQAEDGTIDTRPAVLRVYAIANPQGGWSVMPGGFTRLGATQHDPVSMQAGGSSVDTWVVASAPGSDFSLLPTPLRPADLARKQRTVSSRAAENLFWAGRYGERAENNVRLLRAILSSLETEAADDWVGMLTDLATHCGLLPADTAAPASTQALERLLILHLSESGAGFGGSPRPTAASVGQNLDNQTRANSEIRSRLSSDHWRTVLAARNDFRDGMRRFSASFDGASYDRLALVQTLETLSMQLLAITGAQRDRMTRDEAWMLMFAGRHIERVWTLSTFLRIVADHGQLHRPSGFDLLLQLFDSTLTYRSLYPGRYEVPALIDLLIVDRDNPRGLYGVVARLGLRLDGIAAAAGGGAAGAPTMFDSFRRLQAALPDLEALCAPAAGYGHAVDRIALTSLCDELRDAVTQTANEISARFFSHASMQAWGVGP